MNTNVLLYIWLLLTFYYVTNFKFYSLFIYYSNEVLLLNVYKMLSSLFRTLCKFVKPKHEKTY